MSLPRTPQLVQEAKRLRLENGDLRGHNAHLQEDNTRLVHKQNELLLTISTLQDAHMKLQEARIRQLESGQAAAVARPAAPAAPATPVAVPSPRPGEGGGETETESVGRKESDEGDVTDAAAGWPRSSAPSSSASSASSPCASCEGREERTRGCEREGVNESG
jgi:hypothetical protein